MPLHVLQLGPYPPPEGGISRNILAIRDELIAAGHQCSIVVTSRSSSVTSEHDVYHPRSPLALIALLRKLRFDVLHLHIGGDVTARVLALAFVCSIFGRDRSVLTLHSGGFAVSDEADGARPGSFAGRVFRRFSRIIAVNAKLADVFRRFGATRINVIPPYALKRPDPNVIVPDELAVFCGAHTPLLLAVGGLEKDYDPLLQVAAMMEVTAEAPKTGLMIVGGGSIKSEVEAAVAASGCSDAIMLAGNVEHAVTLHLMRDADIVLRTTLFDGDAISVREALFLGTPVIATDTGDRPEGVHLIEIGDKDALVKKVREIYKSPQPEHDEQPADNSNITAVVRLYEELGARRFGQNHGNSSFDTASKARGN